VTPTKIFNTLRSPTSPSWIRPHVCNLPLLLQGIPLPTARHTGSSQRLGGVPICTDGTNRAICAPFLPYGIIETARWVPMPTKLDMHYPKCSALLDPSWSTFPLILWLSQSGRQDSPSGAGVSFVLKAFPPEGLLLTTAFRSLHKWPGSAGRLKPFTDPVTN
jgi:hypothetical protein